MAATAEAAWLREVEAAGGGWDSGAAAAGAKASAAEEGAAAAVLAGLACPSASTGCDRQKVRESGTSTAGESGKDGLQSSRVDQNGRS